MKTIKLTTSKDDGMVSIEWDGFKTRWDMLEMLLFSIFRHYNMKRPGEVRYLIKLMLAAYRNSIDEIGFKKYREGEQKQLTKYRGKGPASSNHKGNAPPCNSNIFKTNSTQYEEG